LKGITRKAVIQICKKNKIKIKIGNFKLKQILNSDHIFICGTAAEIQVVKKINKKIFKTKSGIIDLIKREYKIIKSKSPLLTSKI